MKTVFTFGGNNQYLTYENSMIQLRQSEDMKGLFILAYGCEITHGLNYSMACKALGEAILHYLSCESIVNNEGE